MFKQAVQQLFNFAGLSVHRAATIESLLQETERLRAELRQHKDREIFYAITEDYHANEKKVSIVNGIADFGKADFAELACCIFAGSISNGRIIGQRINEAALLWRAAKMSSGPILEVGREFGGSTLLLLGASERRPMVSVDSAPRHVALADKVFKRPDVARRLKLYDQSSREEIAETEFGMIFIDGDHSYPGICHDIATFWNSLRSFDGKPPLAAFHDAADNPITFVEPVKHACEQLLAEPGIARVVESWGSMLVLEKIGNIDPDRWYAKDHPEFWQQYADPGEPVLKPAVIRGRLRADQPPIETGPDNLLGTDYVDTDAWIKRGFEIERAQLAPENPLRLLRELPEMGEHGIEKTVPLNLSRLRFSAFLRPYRLDTIRLSVRQLDRAVLASVDFVLDERSRIGLAFAKPGVEIINAEFLFQNGYFRCDLAIALPAPLASAVFAVNALDSSGPLTVYQGDRRRGFFINLSSVREIK